jgi:hypothetical protein
MGIMTLTWIDRMAAQAHRGYDEYPETYLD